VIINLEQKRHPGMSGISQHPTSIARELHRKGKIYGRSSWPIRTMDLNQNLWQMEIRCLFWNKETGTSIVT